ncbi:MAG: hypothetical protein LUG95_04325 [Clostridiales bacterium]|nr:hypothetical protein [Clostridiales bacterium]
MKKGLKVFLSVVLCLVVILGLCAGGFFIFYTPSLTADMSEKTGDVTTGASGYLYGLAESGVPSENMTESIDISTVSQKVASGLQHPIGDIDNVYTQLDNTDYDVVYLQDAYSTWYYEQSSIEEMRAEGTYDWQKFLEYDFLPKVEGAVEYLSQTSYSDKVVYCLYNECDNGVWFGETVESEDSEYGVYGDYTVQGEQNFFEAWKMTYDLVKSINPDALIGGPGFCDYDSEEIENFLSYCVENDCVPEIMIYHELNDSSVYHWQEHTEDYREIEEKLGIDELPIIVTEYGRMQDNGMPGKMLQYITQIETSKVYADNAYWRLADNLCDIAADDNSPNSNWWLYRWYTDMEGQTVSIKYQDLFKSNLGKALKGEAEFSSQGFMGLVTITDDEDKIDIICGGRDGSAVVKLKNTDSTALYGQTVHIKIEEVLYEGISGIVTSPVTLKEYNTELGSSLTVDMNDMDEANAYHITVTLADENDTEYENESFIQRFEFESGELLGSAYTYDSAYATTGETEGMVGGMEQEGDGISLTVSVDEDGEYGLNFIYGNSNDGEYDEDGKQDPDDRTDSTVNLSIDGEEQEIILSNTIKSEYTDCYTLTLNLTKGDHTVTVTHNTGTIVLDSLLITESGIVDNVSVLNDADRTDDETQSFLCVVDEDGYYSLSYGDDSEITAVNVNDNSVSVSGNSSTVYLMRGLNYVDVKSAEELGDFTIDGVLDGESGTVYNASDAELSDGATIETDDVAGYEYIDNISCNSGNAQFTVNADKAGVYALTFLYSNNDEGGKHSYNVDLIERYVTIDVNSYEQDVYCRNTYSWNTYKTVTAYVTLEKGENVITLSNSGNTKFDGEDTYAPHIASFMLSEISK